MSGVYKGIKCKNSIKKDRAFTPQPHQKRVLDYFIRSPYKGLLLYHKLGSGKTCTSIMVADRLLQTRKVKKVYVLSPGSLRQNWIDEYCKVCGKSERMLANNYTFITYNFDIHRKLRKLDFNNSLVIIDEVHNLINGVRNNSTNPASIFNKILSSNCRVLALSGTPIFHLWDEEWYYLYRLLKGRVGRYEDIGWWSEPPLRGIVSYYPGSRDDYPTVYYRRPIRIEMSSEQSEAYSEAYWAERKARLIGPPKEHLKFSNPEKYARDFEKWIKAIKYMNTRATSNFYYPYKTRMRILPDKLASEGGWVSDEALSDGMLVTHSKKFVTLIMKILESFDTKHVVFTFFKTKSGVHLLRTLLNKCGIPSRIFSGDLNDKERSRLLEEFNKESNRNGDKIKVLLVTEAGAEGITLLETNNIHLLESSTREKKNTQAIGRVARYKSHSNMPLEKRYVNVYRYWAQPMDWRKEKDVPEKEKGSRKKDKPKKIIGVDEYLYLLGKDITDDNNRFLTRLIENSIENFVEGSEDGDEGEDNECEAETCNLAAALEGQCGEGCECMDSESGNGEGVCRRVRK